MPQSGAAWSAEIPRTSGLRRRSRATYRVHLSVITNSPITRAPKTPRRRGVRLCTAAGPAPLLQIGGVVYGNSFPVHCLDDSPEDVLRQPAGRIAPRPAVAGVRARHRDTIR